MQFPISQDGVFLRKHEAPAAKGDVWLIHGFGDRGFAFEEAFSSPLADEFNLFVPDLPGFGSTPFRPDQPGIVDAAEIMVEMIRKLSKNSAIYVVGHSLGGIVGTRICLALKETVFGYVNVEGNLTPEDAFWSKVAAKAKSPDEFYTGFLDQILGQSVKSEPLQRYYASLKKASPEALVAWGKEAVELSEKNRTGELFAGLTCKKAFFRGGHDYPDETLRFLADKRIDVRVFEGCGHWPMIERADKVYGAIASFFKGDKA